MRDARNTRSTGCTSLSGAGASTGGRGRCSNWHAVWVRQPPGPPRGGRVGRSAGIPLVSALESALTAALGGGNGGPSVTWDTPCHGIRSVVIRGRDPARELEVVEDGRPGFFWVAGTFDGSFVWRARHELSWVALVALVRAFASSSDVAEVTAKWGLPRKLSIPVSVGPPVVLRLRRHLRAQSERSKRRTAGLLESLARAREEFVLNGVLALPEGLTERSWSRNAKDGSGRWIVADHEGWTLDIEQMPGWWMVTVGEIEVYECRVMDHRRLSTLLAGFARRDLRLVESTNPGLQRGTWLETADGEDLTTVAPSPASRSEEFWSRLPGYRVVRRTLADAYESELE